MRVYILFLVMIGGFVWLFIDQVEQKASGQSLIQDMLRS